MDTNTAEFDYLFILKAINEISFGMGKKLLIDFLTGNNKNPSIKKNRLYLKNNFGILAYTKQEIEDLIDKTSDHGFIEQVSLNKNHFWKVFELTEKGRQELKSPKGIDEKTKKTEKKELTIKTKTQESKITDAEKKVFGIFGEFLSRYNDPQKKAIINNSEKILCIAGAGTGKTTVLTKRIEFLVKYKSVKPDQILAITFTRKARHEMITRLLESGLGNYVNIETFNSFSERILKKYNDIIYDRDFKVLKYKNKIAITNKALSNLGFDFSTARDIYFTRAQKRNKSDEQLANLFVNDCFFALDYLKYKGLAINEASFETRISSHKESTDLIIGVCSIINSYMKSHGLRDFSDQLLDTIKLFSERKDLIPKFTHVLVDEYQDVNSSQIKLIDLLNPKNLFCVGDPRQSIFGWRGSDIKYILNFKNKYPKAETIHLTKNYRSTEHIVKLINSSIKSMNLPDLESDKKGEKDIELVKFRSEEDEFEYVIKKIISSDEKRNEIFVLARTNRQLNELSKRMNQKSIKHIIRSDEIKKSLVAKDDEITLATIHAIKGLEAKQVFIIGCNSINFPIKGSEHPVTELIDVEEYDKDEEERRVFYVALSRAKQKLCMTYTGKKPTKFINNEMKKIIEEREFESSYKLNKSTKKGSSSIISRLRDWRLSVSEDLGIPGYEILTDRSMIEIASKKPMTTSDLYSIKGMSPTKIKRFGEEILNIVNGL